jgi:NTP pyrophosphatase (non-canonical NTP hydrolase)
VRIFSIGSRVWPGISKLVEEAGEVLQLCGKLMGKDGENEHWNVPDLKAAMEDELGDLMAAIAYVVVYCHLDDEKIVARADKKTELYEKWHKENGGDVLMDEASVCQLPPKGWECLRLAGHIGPCAASPITNKKDEEEP